MNAANHDDHDDDLLARVLGLPLLDVPPDFTARVMAALPAQPARRRPALPRAGRFLQVAALALCGAFGAIEILLFVGGLWVATTLAIG